MNLPRCPAASHRSFTERVAIFHGSYTPLSTHLPPRTTRKNPEAHEFVPARAPRVTGDLSTGLYCGVLNEWREKIAREIAELDHELRVELPKEIRQAVELGDLAENAEYSAALERQEFIRARLSHLQRRLTEIGRLSPRDIPRDRIALGSRVVVKLDSGEDMEVFLVLPEFVEHENRSVSVNSPIGRALLGKRAGERVCFELPGGLQEALVCSFETVHALSARSHEA
jgi:transcription elongation factor GreA